VRCEIEKERKKMLYEKLWENLNKQSSSLAAWENCIWSPLTSVCFFTHEKKIVCVSFIDIFCWGAVEIGKKVLSSFQVKHLTLTICKCKTFSRLVLIWIFLVCFFFCEKNFSWFWSWKFLIWCSAIESEKKLKFFGENPFYPRR
jgi:hypothetical protein